MPNIFRGFLATSSQKLKKNSNTGTGVNGSANEPLKDSGDFKSNLRANARENSRANFSATSRVNSRKNSWTRFFKHNTQSSDTSSRLTTTSLVKRSASVILALSISLSSACAKPTEVDEVVNPSDQLPSLVNEAKDNVGHTKATEETTSTSTAIEIPASELEKLTSASTSLNKGRKDEDRQNRQIDDHEQARISAKTKTSAAKQPKSTPISEDFAYRPTVSKGNNSQTGSGSRSGSGNSKTPGKASKGGGNGNGNGKGQNASVTNTAASQKGTSATSTTEQTEFNVNLTISFASLAQNPGALPAFIRSFIPEGGYLASNENIVVKKGSTAADLTKNYLNSINVPYEVRGSGKNQYFAGINNIYEFDAGMNSGWLYRVNGVLVNYGMGECVLKPGDKIYIYYTIDYTKDN